MGLPLRSIHPDHGGPRAPPGRTPNKTRYGPARIAGFPDSRSFSGVKTDVWCTNQSVPRIWVWCCGDCEFCVDDGDTTVTGCEIRMRGLIASIPPKQSLDGALSIVLNLHP